MSLYKDKYNHYMHKLGMTLLQSIQFPASQPTTLQIQVLYSSPSTQFVEELYACSFILLKWSALD